MSKKESASDAGSVNSDLLEEMRFVGKLLSVMIYSQLKQDDETVTKQVERLHKHGFSSNEIARVLGISPGYASKEVSTLKKRLGQREKSTGANSGGTD